MLHPKTINEAQVRQAMDSGEFTPEVIHSSRNVALLLTQGWCPEWMAMHRWLERMIAKEEPRDVELDLYQLVYDRVSYFREFLAFKETTFGNYQVPYVRYYVDGRLVGESNYCNQEQFLRHFRS